MSRKVCRISESATWMPLVGVYATLSSRMGSSWVLEAATSMIGRDGQGLELDFLQAIHRTVPASWEPWMQAITWLGSLEALGGLVLAVALTRAWRRDWESLRLVAASGLLALLLRQGLKQLFHRARPELWASLPDASYSFPSGHALSSVIIYGVMVYLISRSHPHWRWILWAFYSVLVAMIGFSRLYLGFHWPIDVLGGWAVGVLALFGLIRWHQGRFRLLTSLWSKLRGLLTH